MTTTAQPSPAPTVHAGGLSALFAPNAVAIIGASDDTTKYGNWISVQALTGSIPVHLVNPNRATVLGRPTVPSLAAIGTQVDLAIICVPVKAYEAAVDAALAAGVKALVGITAGLGEAGAEGVALQERIVAKVRAAGARMLGPNCLGVLDHTSGLLAASNEFPVGNIGIISQSGNMALELRKWLVDHDLGVSRFASLGNQSDVDAADLIEAYAAHEGTDAIAVYVEDFRDGRRFAQAALHARQAGKPVVLLTVGSTEASVRNAKSHTGALVSSALVVDAACAAAGIERVDSPAQMAHLLQGLTKVKRPDGNRVAVFADGGGGASVASDSASSHGLNVVEFSTALQSSLLAELPANAPVSNPVDVAGGGEQDITCFHRVLDKLATTNEVDCTLMSSYFGGYGDYGGDLATAEIATAHLMARAVQDAEASVIVQTMNSTSTAASVLRTKGIPVYRGIEEAAWVLGRMSASAPIENLGIPELPPRAPALVETDYARARAALAASGIGFVAAHEVETREALLSRARTMAYPLVLKALGDEHKSDRGGVILNIANEAALLGAWDHVQELLAPPSCSVEEMLDLSQSVELLVGVRQDPRFGPIVLVGLGGIFAEILKDVKAALGPVTGAQAKKLLLSLRGAALLTGARGRAPVDLDAAADLISKLSFFAAAHPEIGEVECNPVAATPTGATALDARIILN